MILDFSGSSLTLSGRNKSKKIEVSKIIKPNPFIGVVNQKSKIKKIKLVDALLVNQFYFLSDMPTEGGERKPKINPHLKFKISSPTCKQ